MGESNKRLSRENVQEFLTKTSETGEVKGEALKEVTKAKKRGFAGTLASGGATLAGKMAKGANTLGGTLVEGVKSEMSHSDFVVRMKSIGVGIAATAIVLAFMFLPAISSSNLTAYDLKLKHRFRAMPESGSIVHLDLDDQTISSVGRFPWPRSHWAGFSRACKEAGVRHTVFDIEFWQGQQEEVDTSAFNEFRRWGKDDLPQKVGSNLKTWTDSLALHLDAANAAKNAIDAANTEEALKAARDDLARALSEVKRLRDLISASEMSQELISQFDELSGSVVVDHDGRFAEAVLEVGNVVLPLHFDKSSLVLEQSDRPSVSRDLFERYEKHLNENFPQDLQRSGREAVAAAAVGAKVYSVAEEREITVDAELAEKYSLQAYINMRSLYLYRMVRKWYSGVPEEDLRKDMDAYVADWTGFTGSLFAEGKLFGRLARAYQDKGFAHDWVSQAAEQLHRYYSWNLMVTRNAAGGLPWSFPTSVIDGYDPKSYDPWAPVPVSGSHGGSGIIHYRDIGFVPAIFRLLDGAHNTGFVSIEHDPDGTVRGIPLFVVYEETYSGERRVMPQLAFQALMLELATDPKSLVIKPGEYVEFRAVKSLVEALRADEPLSQAEWEREAAQSGRPEAMETFRLKIDGRCVMRVNWVGGNNPPFYEVFGHFPISRLIDIAGNQDEIRRNELGLQEFLRAPVNQFGDSVPYAVVKGGAQGVPGYFGQPPRRVASFLFDKLSTVGLTPRNAIRDFVVSEIRTALERRAAYAAREDVRAQYREAEALPDAEKRKRIKELGDEEKAAESLHLGPFLHRLGRKLGEVFGFEANADAAARAAAMSAHGVTAEVAAELAAAFEGVPDGPLPEGFQLAGLAMAANADWMTPINTTFPLRKVTKLSPADRAKITLAFFELVMAVDRPGHGFEDAAAEIEATIAAAYGLGNLSEAGPDIAADIASFRSEAIGAAIAKGRAFRRLLWDLNAPPYGAPEVAAARESGDPAMVAKGARRLVWELPLWIESGMLDPAHELAVEFGTLASHPWVKAGVDDASPVPEELAGFAARLLTHEEASAALVARRIQRQHALATEATGRFKETLDKSVSFAAKHVANRFALAGWAATGQGDIIVTSNSKSIPGPALHSNTFNTALFAMEPVDLTLWTVVVAMLGGGIVSLCAARFSVKWGITSLVATLVLFVLADSLVFSNTSTTFLTLTVIVPWLACFLSIQVYRYAVEYRAKLKIKGQFGKFLSQEAVEELQKNPDMLKLGGDERELCVMFSDIAGFTPISESMSASRLIDFLNDYMGRMCASIKDSKGYVDKFIGDAIMAIWGAPVTVPDYSARAVKTAVRNTQSLAAWNRERKERGELEVGARIGLATGPMVAGNMGTEWKLNYTCIGDTVNLGSRLEAANKQYGTQVMINELCYEQSKDVIVAHIMDKIAVKGKKKGLPVYHVVGLVGETEPRYIKGCEAYTKGFELYQQEKWAEAIPYFKEAKENLPPPYQVKEGPYDLMIERCEHLQHATPEERMEILHLKAPGDEWDGVWKLTSK